MQAIHTLDQGAPEQERAPGLTVSRAEIMVIAASLGGVAALSTVLGALPASFPIPIAVVQHQQATASSDLLTELLQKRTALRVRLARTGESLRPGTVYVAPPGRHFAVSESQTVSLLDGPRMHGLTSAADPLFSSAALVYRSAVVAVVLTGTDGDGAAGATAVRNGGGMVVVQDPNEAEAAGMPLSTLAACGADWILPLDAIATRLLALAGMPSPAGDTPPPVASHVQPVP